MKLFFFVKIKNGLQITFPTSSFLVINLAESQKGELCHPYLRRYETAVLHGQAALREALRLRQDGFKPDLIIGHSGLAIRYISKRFGQTPNSLVISKWFYRSQGADVGFGNNQPPSPDTSLRVHTYNSPIVMDLAQCDAAICPTHWQADQFPPNMRQHLSVIFDGVDTEQLAFVEQSARLHGLNIASWVCQSLNPCRCTFGHLCNPLL